MKKLFLSSSFADVMDLFTHFIGDIRGKTITFITTASNVEKITFYVENAKQAFIQQGAQIDELDVTKATFTQISDKLNHNDFIYVSGGNTFFLLQELKRSGADKLIIQQVNAGKLYIGESAGAMIASPDINYVELMDSREPAADLVDNNALNLVKFYPVPHYTNFPFIEAAQHIIDTYSATLNLIPITNTQAIVVNNDIVEIKTQN
ncbi:Type 1 glutamine amidotransferase-like domain-containing protein [Pasteurella canis]|uniref:Type 1 glutamine amidotransferase-like domain-containing protein n=1 Tax=Pasteurella canis TaxID=753 RepID=UPI000D9398E3|nr:Type 1 glutamine amidotransferase-like domain-containing protein [Pasteurella canis]UDW83507.1 Type 1 glutamine amidotransferase-like domain-containing protein [Pasteurella canis]SPY34087.1 peptidase S51 [Pasteurella canis]